MGFAVKLDTNGSMPDRLKHLVNTGLVDYVAMDIKNSPENYAKTVGCPNLSMDKIQESVDFLLSNTVPYEFRTTVVREFHTDRDMEQIGRWIKGANKYFLQEFVDSGSLIGEGLHAVSRKGEEVFRGIASAYVPATELRGA